MLNVFIFKNKDITSTFTDVVLVSLLLTLNRLSMSQQTFTCSKLTIEPLEKDVKFVQSKQ